MVKEIDTTNGLNNQFPYSKDDYLRLIEEGRENLSDDQMGVLFALYEEDDIRSACQALGMSQGNLEQIFETIIATPEIPQDDQPQPAVAERQNKDGSVRRKRLANAVLLRIAQERDDLTDDEREIIQAAATSHNQVIAAAALNITFKEFVKRYSAIRRAHDF